jgi:hypothetical protein
MDTIATSVGVATPNLRGLHPPIKRTTACGIAEALRSKDLPDKAIRFAVGVRPDVSDHAKYRRMQNMVSAYNRCSSFLRYSTTTPGQADDEATLKAKQEGAEVAAWVSANLPVSRTDARMIGHQDNLGPLFSRECWDYGPWATQVLRSCNFPIVSENVCHLDSC